MRRSLIVVISAAMLFASLSTASCQEWPGQRADGSILLPNGWSLDPHGEQLTLPSDLPVRSAWHPGGRYLAIQHCGFRKHVIAIYDAASNRIVAEMPLSKSWSGFAWSADGSWLCASGGVDDIVRFFSFDPATAESKELRTAKVGEPDRLDVPAGMCVDADERVFVVLQRGAQVLRLSSAGETELTVDLPEGSMPFECALSADEATVFVSLWGRGEIVALDAETGAEQYRVATGEHPSEMLLSPAGDRLFVSNANENTVSAIDLASRAVTETISSALFAAAPPGSTPNSLAITPDASILLIANADNNNCALIDVSEPGEAKGLGYIPLGWYPTSIRLAPDGETVYVLNGKGSGGSQPNPGGPESPKPAGIEQYLGAMFIGSLTRFAFPTPDELGALSARAYACSPLDATAGARDLDARPEGSPIPAKVGDPSPIKHCIYIIKENRTYDQVLGDDPRGNGDASLCIFGREVTPNHHAIAEEFVLLDNFYVESEVSADGHEWTMGAYATDFVERTWPVNYGGKGDATLESGRRAGLGFPAEGQFRIATPKSGYLWDMAREAGVSYRSYGEFINASASPEKPSSTKVDTLQGHFDPLFRPWDLSYPDVKRAERFLTELAEFERAGEMPQLIVMRLPNDHTSGTSVGAPTPRAQVADNDLALGMVLEGLSKSRFWPELAVFVVEDDAQNGSDHVDAHRTIGFVVSPYVKRGEVVSAMYSTCSMLRTMELILGLEPMSQFDAAARPMYACFADTPDLTGYACKPSAWPLDEINQANAWGADLSASFDLAREDAADDLLLNEVIWRSVRGADSPMPMPVRAAFVRVLED